MSETITISICENFTLTKETSKKVINIADEGICLYYEKINDRKNIILEINRNLNTENADQSEFIRVSYPNAILSLLKTEDTLHETKEFDKFISFNAPVGIVYNGILTVKLQALLNKLGFDRSAGIENSINLMGLLLQILSSCAHCCDVNTKREFQFECKFLINDSSRQKIIMAQQYLHSNICEPITIKKLSMIVGINECYLKKGFKEMTGKTINDYFQQIRMDKAIELLKSKTMNVTEVSNYLGFKSLSHFSSVIKKLTGANACDIINW